ncbi:hypothetical protein CEUSTIGMA_g3306.t1 [Chlamydomonas eustigma]|uniref:Elongation factor Ts, mitochondrial n=1 Tax=Chlamydomonas eustigma TaxID=1157962 RepID=A0A250WYE5_9CHLO|nr:hypothetical protein CEUSTIGMA_g3306.t1 [Chlamydomonas eustigma]|eukprot:GAX75863.1 hypothetical protein CEUSTIGMA_g3306.t1 [Chlamydomonas eustigma]
MLASRCILAILGLPKCTLPVNNLLVRGIAASATEQIKALREKSGAPISDVKACLVEAGWDMEKAYEALRKKGLAAAAKKASRQATEGLVGLASHPGIDNLGPKFAVVEINSETDFVARSDLFRGLVSKVTQVALTLKGCTASGSGVLEELMTARTPGGETVSEACAQVAAQVRENVRLRRAFLLQGSPGSIAEGYLHMSPAPGLGSIASVIILKSEPAGALSNEVRAQASELVSGLAMHAAGMRPLYVDRHSVPPEVLQHERQVLSVQAAGSGKPEAVIAKMVEGRLSKYYEDSCLLDQSYLLDDSVKVKGIIDRLSEQAGCKFSVEGMFRVQVGEGLEAAGREDFAQEVSKMMQNS